MKAVLALCLVGVCLVNVNGAPLKAEEDKNKLSASVSNGFIDDVIVESTLSVRKKTSPGRQGRQQTIVKTDPNKVEGTSIVTLKRDKRQNKRRYPQNFGFSSPFGEQGNFGQQQQRPFGFQNFEPIRGSASNAAAQAQGFESHSPWGGFGASAANAGSQGFSYDENGIRGNAGLSGTQQYHLPNGQSLSISYANGFNVGSDGKPTFTNGNSIAFTGPNGQPIRNPQFGGAPQESDE